MNVDNSATRRTVLDLEVTREQNLVVHSCACVQALLADQNDRPTSTSVARHEATIFLKGGALERCSGLP